jgi:hypothetical protein
MNTLNVKFKNKGEIKMYGSINGVKDRRKIVYTDTEHDVQIEKCLNEASNFIDMNLFQYEATLPITPNEEICAICNDLAVALFNRREMPESVDTGYWAVGISKLKIYIANHYEFSDKSFSWNTKDPDKILNALDRGAINIQTARALLKALTYDPTLLTVAEISQINKQCDLIDAEIAKMIQDGLLVEAETVKLAGVDSTKVTAETTKINADTLIVPKEGERIDAETGLIGAQTIKLSGADTSLITEQIARIVAEVAKLSGVDTSLVSKQIDMLIAQIIQLGKQGSLTDAQTALLISEKAVLDLKIAEQIENEKRNRLAGPISHPPNT